MRLWLSQHNNLVRCAVHHMVASTDWRLLPTGIYYALIIATQRHCELDTVGPCCWRFISSLPSTVMLTFLTRDAFVKTNRCAIAMMFVRLSVWDGRALWSYGHISTDLSLWLDSPMFWTPWHQSMSTYSQPSFSSSTWEWGGVSMCKLGMISLERLKTEVTLGPICYEAYPASIGTTTDDLEWPWTFKINIIRIARYLCGSWALVVNAIVCLCLTITNCDRDLHEAWLILLSVLQCQRSRWWSCQQLPCKGWTRTASEPLNFTEILSSFFFLLLLLLFRHLRSEFAERNSIKTGHMPESECDLKMHVRNLEYTFP